MEQKLNSTPPEEGESLETLSREEFMDELWARLQKVKQHLYFKDPNASHDPAIANEYRILGNLQLTTGIEKGDLSTYALDELIDRLEKDEFSVESLMELLPHGLSAAQSLETVKKMILHLLARRINNAVSCAGHIGFMGKKDTFKYPSREHLSAGIKDMIRSGLVKERELYGIANNNTVVSVIKETVEDRPAKILAFVLDKLETVGECFGQKQPLKPEEINKSEVLEIKKVKDLMEYLENGRDFIVALTMVIRLIIKGKINPEKFLSEMEKETLFAEPSKARITYLEAIAMKRLNLLAVEAVADMRTGSRLLSDRLIFLVDDLMYKKLLDQDKLYSEITPELRQIIMGGHADLDELERVTLPGAQESSQAAFCNEQTMKSMPVFINTPEGIVEGTKERIETAPTYKMPSYRPLAEAVLPSPPDEPDAPAKPTTPQEPIYPVINHPENPDLLLMPVARLQIGDNTVEVPLFQTARYDKSGYYVYKVGTDSDCDIIINPDQSRHVNKVHCLLRIRQNTVQTRAEEGITIIKGMKNAIRGWKELNSGMELEIGEGGQIITLTVEAPGEVKKDIVRDHLETRLAILEDKRRKIIADFRDEGEEWEEINTLLNELENLDAKFNIGCKSPESYKRLRARTMEPREQFVLQQIARLENRRKENTVERIIKEQNEITKREENEIRNRQIKERTVVEQFQKLHIAPDENPETAPIAWRGWVIELVDYAENQSQSLRPMLISSRTFGTHPACTDEICNPERQTINAKYDAKEFMAEVLPNRDNPNKLIVNWISGLVQVKDDNGIFGSPKSNPFEVTEGDTVRIGRYDLHIIGKDHAFTPRALLPYAKDLIDQAVERIFESDRTTTEQDRTDHENVEKLIKLNVAPIPGSADGEGEQLRDYAVKWYKREFDKLWDNLKKWNPEKPDFDAKDFPTIQMLLGLSEEPGSFVPCLGISEADLKATAEKRIKRYLLAGEKTYSDYKYHYLNGVKRLRNLLEERLNPKLREDGQMEKRIADEGVKEIAKFILELNLFTQEEITLATTDSYAHKIEQNIRIRELFDILEHEQCTKRLVAVIGQLRVLSAKKKLGDVFTPSEIAIRDLNLELNFSADDSLQQSYIAQKATLVARTAYKKAQEIACDFNPEKDDPSELEQSLFILDKLLWMNIFDLLKLNDNINQIKNEQQIAQTIKKMWEKAKMARNRIIGENIEEQKSVESKRAYLEDLHSRQMEIIEKVAIVRKTLFSVDVCSVESFELMHDLCDFVADPSVANDAGKIGVEVTGAIMKIRHNLGAGDSRQKARSSEVAIAEVKSHPFIETWEDVKREWWKKYEQAARSLAQKVIVGDERAFYLSCLLKEALRKNHLVEAELGVDMSALEKGVELADRKKKEMESQKKEAEQKAKWESHLERINDLRNQLLAGDDDDFDYLDEEPFFANESDEHMKEKLFELQSRITSEKIGRCLKHVNDGDRAYYFLRLAKEAAEKDPQAVTALTKEEFDLLQYGK